MDTVRAFISFEPPLFIKKEILEVQMKLAESRADIRWEPTERLHATIKFLGNIDRARLPGVLEAIEKTTKEHACFEITYEHLGVFPDKRHPAVVWVGCKT